MMIILFRCEEDILFIEGDVKNLSMVTWIDIVHRWQWYKWGRGICQKDVSVYQSVKAESAGLVHSNVW